VGTRAFGVLCFIEGYGVEYWFSECPIIGGGVFDACDGRVCWLNRGFGVLGRRARGWRRFRRGGAR
jgi:hypothetical protein